MVVVINDLDFSRPLREQAVSSSTAARYLDGFKVFQRFVRMYYQLDVSKVSPVVLDFLFDRFINAMWKCSKGRRRQLCVNALQGILQVLGFHLKPPFSNSQRSLKAWARRVPSTSASPMPQH